MPTREFNNRLYPQVARVAQALASDKRLEVLDILAQSPRHVDSLAQEAGMSVANASQHLQVLRGAGLVQAERRGNMIFYSLADPDVIRLWLALRGVAESRLAEVKQLAHEFHSARDLGNLVTRGEAEVLSRQNALLLDVRPAAEFESGHLRGAFNIPLDDLPERMQELPRDRRIITYCRGLYCLLADEAAAFLVANGFDVVRLEGGWPEWQSEGRPVKGSVR
jgi:rhodanese-related sulfurtransferase